MIQHVASISCLYWETGDSGRHVTSVFQCLSLSLAPGDGKERTLATRLTDDKSFIAHVRIHTLTN